MEMSDVTSFNDTEMEESVEVELGSVVDQIKLIKMKLASTKYHINFLQKQLNDTLDIEKQLNAELQEQLDKETGLINQIRAGSNFVDLQIKNEVVDYDMDDNADHEEESVVPQQSARKKITVAKPLKTTGKILNVKAKIITDIGTKGVNSRNPDLPQHGKSSGSRKETLGDLRYDKPTDAGGHVMQQQTQTLYQCAKCKVYCTASKSALLRHVNRNQCLPAESTETGNDPSGVGETSTPSSQVFLYHCPKCRVYYRNKYSLNRHMREGKCYDGPGRNKACFGCGNANVAEWSRCTVKRDRICLLCEKLYSEVTGSDAAAGTSSEKRFACAMCKRSSGTRRQMWCHIRRHTGYRPFFCTKCHRTCLSAEGLKKHMLDHDYKNVAETKQVRDNVEESTACSVCGNDNVTAWFKQGGPGGNCERICATCGNLVGDLGKTSDDSESKRYVCLICQHSYKKPSLIWVHIRRHTGYRPYKCIKCNVGFISPEVLKKHKESKHSISETYKYSKQGIKTGQKAQISSSAGEEDDEESAAVADEEFLDAEEEVMDSGEDADKSLLAGTEEHAAEEEEHAADEEEQAEEEEEHAEEEEEHAEEEEEHAEEEDNVRSTNNDQVGSDNVCVSGACFICGKDNIAEWSTCVCRSKNALICVPCEKLFCDQKVPSDKVWPSSYNRFVCLTCQHSSKQLSLMWLHLRRHTGFRPFVCQVCGQGCISVGDLNGHMITHAQLGSEDALLLV